jgi:hypothetical protein
MLDYLFINILEALVNFQKYSSREDKHYNYFGFDQSLNEIIAEILKI